MHSAAGPSPHPVADWLLDMALIVGPYLAVCLLAYLLREIYRGIRDLLHQANRQVDDALTTPVPAAADNQPGTDTDLLDAITAAWNADTRKETP
ncbi:hypothetical protein [Streptomyces althioticus]|uniref:hypothetical protein n=1 Tax=Streptomyces althioticus TaxID=83380 RepID=UPI0033E149A3